VPPFLLPPGKTHTLGRLAEGAGDALRGVAPRALEDVLAWAEAQRGAGAACSVTAQYVQIYMDGVFDLLSDEHAPVAIAEDRATGEVLLQGAATAALRCAADGDALLRAGEARRAAAATRLNAASSRSHAVLAVTVQAAGRRSKLLLVDLAGSERVARSGVQGIHLEEAKAVNLSLTALGKCVAALAAPGGPAAHVPFRDSRLTRVLRDALGGRCRSSIIACIAPGRDHAGESSATLAFASRARCMTENSAPGASRPRGEEADYRALCRKLAAQVDALHLAHESALARAAAADAAAADATAQAAAREAAAAAGALDALSRPAGASAGGAAPSAPVEALRVLAALQAEAAAEAAAEREPGSSAGAVAAARAEVVAAVVAVAGKRADAAEAAQRAAEARVRLADAQASVLRASADAAAAAAEAAEARAAEAEARAELAEGAAAAVRAEGAAAGTRPPSPSPLPLSPDATTAFYDALAALRDEVATLPRDAGQGDDVAAAVEGRIWLAVQAARQRRMRDHGSGASLASDEGGAEPAPRTAVAAALSAAAVSAAGGDAGALSALCAGLRCGDADVRAHAAKLVANAAADDAAAAAMVAAGAPLRALVAALHGAGEGEAEPCLRTQRCAAGALANLAMTEAHARALVACGALGALCACADASADAQTQRCAAGALANLCGNAAVEQPLFAAGALQVLARLAAGPRADVASQAARGLGNAARSAAGRDALRAAGAAEPLRALAATQLAPGVRAHVAAALRHLDAPE